jgi:hypothetical protein
MTNQRPHHHPISDENLQVIGHSDIYYLRDLRWFSLGVLYPLMIWQSATLFENSSKNPNKALRYICAMFFGLLASLNIAGYVTNIFNIWKYKGIQELLLRVNILQDHFSAAFNAFLAAASCLPWFRASLNEKLIGDRLMSHLLLMLIYRLIYPDYPPLE